jgi:hypothetical protein
MAKKKSKRSKKTAEDRQFEKAEKVLRKRWRQILSRKGVTAVDVNYRTRDGKLTNEIVICIHVEKKRPLAELRKNQYFTSIDGIPVDVVESQNTYEPLATDLQGGDKIAPRHKSSAAGTMGIVCFTKGARQPRFLTNAHVVYGGKKKSQLRSRIPMVIPSGSKPEIGDGLRDRSFRNALIDCALIEPAPGQLYKTGVRGLTVQPTGFGELTRDDVKHKVQVKKVGAKTGPREGIVDSIRLTFIAPGQGFMFQIGIKPLDGGSPFSAGGDSGSVVIRDKEVVGLLHGVTNSGTIAVACHIKHVVKKLDIEL